MRGWRGRKEGRPAVVVDLAGKVGGKQRWAGLGVAAVAVLEVVDSWRWAWRRFD